MKFKTLLNIIQLKHTCIDSTCRIKVTYAKESIIKIEMSVLSSVVNWGLIKIFVLTIIWDYVCLVSMLL